MGKVDRLCNRVEPFAALFWALSIISTVQYLLTHLTLPVGLASLHRRTQSMPLYDSILNKDSLASPLFLSSKAYY